MKKIFVLIFVSSLLFAQERIFIDNNYSDWSDTSKVYSDPSNDNNGGVIDFKKFWVSNDEEYLYFRIQTGGEIVLVNDDFAPQYITLYLDTDNDAQTGKSINGIGAELEFTFSERKGTAFLNGAENFYHEDIGFYNAPTFSGDEFEFAIKRDASIAGVNLFNNNKIKIVFAAYSSSQKSDYYDITPDNSGFEFKFNSDIPYPTADYTINKSNENYLRLMSYNIEQDGILDNDKTTEFNHIFTALNPDIIGFTEVYDGTSAQVASRIDFFLPPGDGEMWYHKKASDTYDIVLVSRYEIKQSFTIYSDVGHDASGAFLLDLRPKYDTDMLVIVSHPKCCSYKGDEDEKRQNQFDAIIQFIRNAVNEGGPLTIAQNTPIAIMGDMNLVGDSRQYQTLITGDIKYNVNYGDDFIPDWDNSDLDDAKPCATNTNMTYTTNVGSYPPGRLDYIVYTGSVISLLNTFALDAGKLTEDQLNEFGMSKDDTKVSDHLPLIADIEFKNVTGVKKKISPK